jgi:hypothetical protein
LNSPFDERGMAGLPDVRKMRFQLIDDAREICVNRTRLNVMRHESHEKGQGVGCGVNGKAMQIAESEIGIEVWRICTKGTGVESHTQKDGAFVDETL